MVAAFYRLNLNGSTALRFFPVYATISSPTETSSAFWYFSTYPDLTRNTCRNRRPSAVPILALFLERVIFARVGASGGSLEREALCCLGLSDSSAIWNLRLIRLTGILVGVLSRKSSSNNSFANSYFERALCDRYRGFAFEWDTIDGLVYSYSVIYLKLIIFSLRFI